MLLANSNVSVSTTKMNAFLTSSGVNPEYVEFMMGYKTKLYNDVRSKGQEFLLAEYMNAELRTTPKPRLTDRHVIEALLRGRGSTRRRSCAKTPSSFTGSARRTGSRLRPKDWLTRSRRTFSTMRTAYSRLLASVLVARGRFELPSMGFFLLEVQSPSLAGSLFSTLASPLHHRATRDPGLRPRPNKPSA